MSSEARLLAAIPARGGSKGLPGKNIRPLAGLPLIAHSILLAKMCPEIDRVVVSTDSPEIAGVARRFGAVVPFLRPAELAQDDTPMWPVLRHALEFAEREERSEYDYILLLDPTTPCRLPVYIAEAFRTLKARADADGIIGVSQPDFSPIWHTVIDKDGWMTDVFPEATRYDRRQDVPVVYRVNGSLYIWRVDFMRREEMEWRKHGKHLMYETPDFSAISIDTKEEFERAELFVKAGLVQLPWLFEKTVQAREPSQ